MARLFGSCADLHLDHLRAWQAGLSAESIEKGLGQYGIQTTDVAMQMLGATTIIADGVEHRVGIARIDIDASAYSWLQSAYGMDAPDEPTLFVASLDGRLIGSSTVDPEQAVESLREQLEARAS